MLHDRGWGNGADGHSGRRGHGGIIWLIWLPSVVRPIHGLVYKVVENADTQVRVTRDKHGCVSSASGYRAGSKCAWLTIGGDGDCIPIRTPPLTVLPPSPCASVSNVGARSAFRTPAEGSAATSW